jgi:hypothetical protein
MMATRFTFRFFVVLLCGCLLSSHTSAQVDKNLEPISYESTEPSDLVAQLKSELQSDDKANELEWDQRFGWLPSILSALEIPRSSQTLVFSKTSQQHRKINPSSPRAIYFNDNVYVGFVQKGDFLEIASVDPEQGAIFYTVDQLNKAKPEITRASSQCMSCHESHKTIDVPGFLVRSVFPKKSGHPKLNLGTTHTDHSTPISDRFGGWYVTGDHGEMRHRGNAVVDEKVEGNLDREPGANLTDLPARARPDSHLEQSSDIVALMLLEHQTQFHNHVTKASYTTRQALHQQAVMNKLFERPAEYRSDTTKRRLETAADDLVEYLFFANEFELTSPIRGDSSFSREFESRGIRTSKGLSLRDLDLKKRMLKHPCSYLIYTKSFNSLPPTMLKLVRSKMLTVLRTTGKGTKFEHLSKTDRESILSILTETHPLFEDLDH